jgi:hypothetical protein
LAAVAGGTSGSKLQPGFSFQSGLLLLNLPAVPADSNGTAKEHKKHIKEEIHPGVSLEIAEADLKKCGFKTTMDPALRNSLQTNVATTK